MQEVTFQFELLIVVHAIEYVGCDFKKLFYQSLITNICGMNINALQEFRITFIRLFLEFFVCVDLIAFGLQNPTKSLSVHIVNVILVEFKRICLVLEDLIVIDLREVLTKQELCRLRVLFSIQSIYFTFHLILLIYLLISYVRNRCIIPDRFHGICIHQIFLIEQQAQQLFLKIMIFDPGLFIYVVLSVDLYFGCLGDWINK